MFDEFMLTTGNDEAASRMAVSIINNYIEEDIRYANAKRFSENAKDFINEIESFIEGVTFAMPSVDIIYESPRIWRRLQFRGDSGWHRTNKALIQAAGLMHRRDRMPLKHLSDEEFVIIHNVYVQIRQAWAARCGEPS